MYCIKWKRLSYSSKAFFTVSSKLHFAPSSHADWNAAPLTFMNTEMVNLVSQGGTENLLAKINYHVTINANGVVAVFFDDEPLEGVG